MSTTLLDEATATALWMDGELKEPLTLETLLNRYPLPARLDFPLEARAAALRHAADWIEAGAPLGVQHALFQDHLDADTGELIATRRCAMGEAMLYLDEDAEHWSGVPPHVALLRLDDPEGASLLLTGVIETFDSMYDRREQCACLLRECADVLDSQLVPA